MTERTPTTETPPMIEPKVGEKYVTVSSGEEVEIIRVTERGTNKLVGYINKNTGRGYTRALATFARDFEKLHEVPPEDQAETGAENVFKKLGIAEGGVIKFGHGGTATVIALTDGSMVVEYPNGKTKEIMVDSADDLERQNITVISQGEEAAAESESTEQIIMKEVVFEEIDRKKGGRHKRFVSNDPNRKQIQLIAKSPLPKPGASYTVEIVRDTKPADPQKGILFARIIEEADDVLAGVPMAEPQRVSYEKLSGPVLPIEIFEDQRMVMVGEVPVPMAELRGPLTPDHNKFRDTYTLDERTLEVLITIAEAVQTGQSCLLTGETATSKTSAIEYLASITGHEVVRINLSGQTDTSELIGKYVPNDGRLQIEFEQLLKHPEQLSEQSREILENIQREVAQTKQSRGLNKWESQQIAKQEGLEVPEWRWQDGKVVDAMKRGAWLILDEVNLADPAIRERLNPVLEVPPSIVLTEHEGERIIQLSPEQQEQFESGSLDGTHPIKKGFHIFGTQNSAEYGGRKPMSPAEKRRWLIRKYIPIPDEQQFKANLEFMVYGEQPQITEKDSRGREKVAYKGARTGRSMFPLLRDTPNMRPFLANLASFHHAIAEAASKNQIARSKKEKEIFTRASLVAFMEYICNLKLVDRSYRPPKPISFSDDPAKMIERAIETFYLGKMTSNDDRNHVLALLKAAHILDTQGKSRHTFTKEAEQAAA